MAGKTRLIKLAALLAVVALILCSSFGRTNLVNTTALAEEGPAEEAANPQPAGEETAQSGDGALPAASVEEAEQQPAEDDAAQGSGEIPAQETGGKEESAPPAEEETSQDSGNEEESAPPAAEDTEPLPAEEAAQDPGEALPPAAEDEEESALPAEEAGNADGEETVPDAEEKSAPESGGETGQPAEPSGDESEETACPADEGIPADSEDTGYAPEEIPEPAGDPAPEEQPGFSGTAEIKLMNTGDLNYGDEIILKAVVRDANTAYRVIWEANAGDSRGWFAVGSGEEYRFILDGETAQRGYRVVLVAAE